MTDFQVIGAGLGRTGTFSMKQALEDLGFTPCHHMWETFIHPERNHKKHLNSILRNENTEKALKAIFGGYKATLDYPGSLFYEEFMKMNPDAKVVLTVRDTPEDWVKSVTSTVFSMHEASNWISWKFQELIRFMVAADHIPVVVQLMASQRGHGVNPVDPKTDLAQLYTDWINRVKETVPTDKLLVFNVKEGWKPLCDFLGVPVPDTPFPRVNSTVEWKKRTGIAKRRAVLTITLFVGLFVLVIWVLLFNILAS
jgi:hypothetical protein